MRQFLSVRQILDELEPCPAAEERAMKDQLEALVAQMHTSGILYSEAVREFKKRFIMNVLIEKRGDQSKTARVLGMHRNTLSRTIAELKLDIRQIKQPRGGYQVRKPAVPAVRNEKAMAQGA